MRLPTILLLSLLASGCAGTVIPKSVEAHASLTKPVPVSGGWIITDEQHDFYNRLIAQYGKDPRLPLPLSKDAGVTPADPGKWFITDARMVDFGVLAGWFRQARPK